jgi:hypothetical protein
MGGGVGRLRLFDDHDSRKMIQPRIGMTQESETGGFMNTSSCKSLDSRAWKELYKAALFEVDNARLPEQLRKQRKHLH